MRGKIGVLKGLMVACLMGTVLITFTLAGQSQEEIKWIKLWDEFGYTGATAAGPAMEKLVDAWMAKHPNIKITRSVLPAVLPMRTTIKLALTAGEAPDLFYTWPAAAVQSSFAKAGYLYDLTDAAKKYGWYERLPELSIDRNSYKGRLYGFPYEQEYMVVYYNKDLFKSLALKEPETYQEFLDQADRIKAAGYIPIAFGNKAQWSATNTLSVLLALTAGKKKEEQVLWGDARWDRPEFVDAVERFAYWADRGYFPMGFNGLGYDEANMLFFQQKAAMNVTGSWLMQDMVRETRGKFELGVFFLPSIYKDLPPSTMAGEGSEWNVWAKTRYPEEVIDFLAYLVSEENESIWITEGLLFPMADIDFSKYPDIHPVVRKMLEGGQKLRPNAVYDLHTTIPESVTFTLYSGLQAVSAKAITPEKFLKDMQKSWEESKELGEIWIP